MPADATVQQQLRRGSLDVGLTLTELVQEQNAALVLPHRLTFLGNHPGRQGRLRSGDVAAVLILDVALEHEADQVRRGLGGKKQRGEPPLLAIPLGHALDGVGHERGLTAAGRRDQLDRLPAVQKGRDNSRELIEMHGSFYSSGLSYPDG